MPEKMSSIRGQDMTMVTLVLDLKALNIKSCTNYHSPLNFSHP